MLPDPNKLRLGSGNVYFDRFDSSGKRTGRRHVGNCPRFATNAAVEKIEKKSSMDGARSLLAEDVIGSTLEVSIELNEFDFNNLALGLMGEVVDLTQAYGAVTDEDINDGETLNLDVWYDLNKLNVSNVEIKQGGPALVEGTDYELKADVGWVMLKSGSDAAEAAATWSGNHGTVSTKKVKGLSVGNVIGELVLLDATDLARGDRYNTTVHKVNLTPDGELNFISDEYGGFTLKGKAQKDTTKPEGEEYLTMVLLNDSVTDVGS